MSTVFYARKREPRLVYDEYEIGTRHNGVFKKCDECSVEEQKFNFIDYEVMEDFIKHTSLYDFVDEYGNTYTRDEMINIISPENIIKQ